jgi:hypothetical protein
VLVHVIGGEGGGGMGCGNGGWKNGVDWICRWNLARRTSRRNKLEVMRHRRVVDEGVCDHVVGVLMSDEEG